LDGGHDTRSLFAYTPYTINFPPRRQ
jgi:hypothetical protein